MAMIKLAVAASLACLFVASADTARSDPLIVQIGDEIARTARSLASSSDGSRIAIGDPAAASGGGSVLVYDHDQGRQRWTQVGVEFTGTGGPPEFGMGDHIGRWVDLSGDGSRLVIGVPAVWDTDQSRTEVYDWDGTSWRQVGSSVTGAGPVSMSTHGSRIAVGGRSGVRVFEWTGTDWTILGDSLIDDSLSSDFGHSVVLSSTGNRVAIGAPGHPETDPPVPGFVRVFDWDGTTWNLTKKGELSGAPGDLLFGWDLAFSGGSANRLVVLTMEGAGGAETATVFDWVGDIDVGQRWTRSGHIAGGSDESWLDTAVAVSEDGRRLAIGDADDDTLVFDWDGAIWQRVARLEPSGSLAMALNGGRIAVGGREIPVRVHEIYESDTFGLDVRCDGDELESNRGVLIVTVDDASQRSYSVSVTSLSTRIVEQFPLSDGSYEETGSEDFGPFASGAYEVVIKPASGPSLELLVDEVTVDCLTLAPTTTPAAPTSPPTGGVLPATGPSGSGKALLILGFAALASGTALRRVRQREPST